MQLANTARLPHYPPSAQERPAKHYFFTGDEALRLEAVLAQPHRHYIEICNHIQLTPVLDFIRYEQPHMSLSLASGTAFHQPVAEYVTRHLRQRLALSHERCEAVKTCLQEAVLNAVIHGNLFVQWQDKSTHSFQHYMHQITQQLSDSGLSRKRVNIFAWFTEHHLTLCVADQGQGFDVQELNCNPYSPHGRGMHMIRSLSERIWQNAPNQLTMQLRVHG